MENLTKHECRNI